MINDKSGSTKIVNEYLRNVRIHKNEFDVKSSMLTIFYHNFSFFFGFSKFFH